MLKVNNTTAPSGTPMLLDLQTRTLSAARADMPESRSVLASVDRVGGFAAKISGTAAALPETFSKERDAAIQQLLTAMEKQQGSRLRKTQEFAILFRRSGFTFLVPTISAAAVFPQAKVSFVMYAMSYVLFAGGGEFKDRDQHGPTKGRGVCVLALTGTEPHRDNQQASR